MLKSMMGVARGCVGAAAAAGVVAALSLSPATAADGAGAGGDGAQEIDPATMALIRAQFGGPIDETKYAALLKLQTAVQTIDGKIQGAKDEAAVTEFKAAREQAFKDAGITEADSKKLLQQIQNIRIMLMAGAMSDKPVDASRVDQALKMFDPVSVATVKAHLKPADGATPGGTTGAAGAAGAAGANGANGAVGTTVASTTGTGGTTATPGDGAATPGTPATTATPGAKPAAIAEESDADPAKLPGTWVLDMDTTVEIMQPGLPADKKGMVVQMFAHQRHPARMVFGPGDKAVAFMANPDGTEAKEGGTFKYADKKLTIVHDDKTQKDDVLDCTMRGELLMVGKGKGKMAFRKKAE